MIRYIGLIEATQTSPTTYTHRYVFYSERDRVPLLGFEHYWRVWAQKPDLLERMPEARCTLDDPFVIKFLLRGEECKNVKPIQYTIDFENE